MQYSTVPPWLRRAAVTHWRSNGRTRHGISANAAQKWYRPEQGCRSLAAKWLPLWASFGSRVSSSQLLTNEIYHILLGMSIPPVGKSPAPEEKCLLSADRVTITAVAAQENTPPPIDERRRNPPPLCAQFAKHGKNTTRSPSAGKHNSEHKLHQKVVELSQK